MCFQVRIPPDRPRWVSLVGGEAEAHPSRKVAGKIAQVLDASEAQTS